jgi:hypothetical protein
MGDLGGRGRAEWPGRLSGETAHDTVGLSRPSQVHVQVQVQGESRALGTQSSTFPTGSYRGNGPGPHDVEEFCITKEGF